MIRNAITRRLHLAEDWIFARPRLVLGVILLGTLGFATQIPQLRIWTDFADLLPQSHSYIQVYDEIREDFGGANAIVFAIEVENGSIFNNDTLALIHQATQGIDAVPSVNHHRLRSLTHRTVRSVHLTPSGNFASDPYYEARNAPYSEAELERMRSRVMADPRVYGPLVSEDMSAALIKAQLNEGGLDYEETFSALLQVRDRLAAEGHRIHMSGHPVLIGWVYTYLSQIVLILVCTLALLVGLLVLHFRRLYGIALPLLGIGLSSIWGLGFMAMMDFNLEPLSLPIPFLIAARAMSHGVQLVARYYEELAQCHDGELSARRALDALFRPGSLAIIVDAVGIGALILGTAPFNYKLGISAGFWALSVLFTVHFMVPLALSILPQPQRTTNNNDGMRDALGALMARTGGNRTGAATVLAVAVTLMVFGGWAGSQVAIGENEPGSPLLKRDHEYNQATAAISRLFPGSDELHVLARTDEPGGIKRPEVLRAIEAFEAHMLADPIAGGSQALPSIVRQVNSLTRNGDPRWAQIPDNSRDIGGLLFAYIASSPTPGALDEYMTPSEDKANLVFYYKDHRGQTVERVIDHARAGIAEIEAGVEGLSLELAGGIVGVTAAVNDALREDHYIIVPAVMLMAFLLVMTYYQSAHAGWLMVLPMLFSTIMTYAYMAWRDIGISVNTVPVIAVGVGVGIDYAVYFMDRIREEVRRTGSVERAAVAAVATTGHAVAFTAITLIAGVVLWIFLSDLRFQVDSALLLSLMLVVNAIAAMFIVPSWCVVFRPRFVMAGADLQATTDAPANATGKRQSAPSL
ncbi:efflux RND transporter permease subunit [Algiphilus sp.]|uniref:efflux RND transporter permease subunit n=1 Tax=Algiphilus sp. TaxID=1872431 RepID=UPI003BABC667